MDLPTKANASRPLAAGYDALIEYGDTAEESLYLRLAAGPQRQITFQTVQPEERGLDVSALPEDMRSESGQTFSRSDFTGGEGLDRAHRRGGTDRDWSRFWDSRNIDVTPSRSGEPAEVKLLHSASSLRSMAAGADRGALVRVGTTLYGIIASATQVDRTANPTASSPTWTQESPGGSGDIADLAVLGDQVYAARDSIRVRSSGGSWSLFTDLDADRLWGVKGRIIAAVGGQLYEARSGAGNSVLLHTLASGQSWTDVIDAGAAILAGASNGEIYAFVDEDGELTLRGQTLIEGEQITALGFGQGLVFVGTGEPTTGGGTIGRLWRFLLIGLRLREGQVLRQWGDGSETRNRAPHRIISTREAVWTGVIEDGTEAHLWRYHLETGGLVRDLVLGASARVHGLVVIDNRVFANLWVNGLWREDTTYASSGYLIGPLADFFNAARKAWVGARLQTGVLPTGTQVVLAYSTDSAAIEDPNHASWTDVITATPAAPGASAEAPLTEVEARYLAGKLTLTPNGTSTATPSAISFAFRALALPSELDVILPVNISDRYERPFRKALTIDGLGVLIYSKLQELRGKAVTATLLRRPGEVVKGQIRDVLAPIPELPDRGSATVFAQVVIRGQRQ